ncbi:hypothetical protein, partial [Neoaquamicrobium sediminum]|uniref:hypothetical protein n=1 Tax=Neoaquamicrobium sediminum TaxID=1849104 RepID=UPI0040373AA0
VDAQWNKDWALGEKDVQEELGKLLAHWDESIAAEEAEASDEEGQPKKGKVAQKEVEALDGEEAEEAEEEDETEDADETEEAEVGESDDDDEV